MTVTRQKSVRNTQEPRYSTEDSNHATDTTADKDDDDRTSSQMPLQFFPVAPTHHHSVRLILQPSPANPHDKPTWLLMIVGRATVGPDKRASFRRSTGDIPAISMQRQKRWFGPLGRTWQSTEAPTPPGQASRHALSCLRYFWIV